jgi:IS30 family transposase
MFYSELSVEERATIQIGHAQGLSQRKIASLINRSPSTISRELRRNRDDCGDYLVSRSPATDAGSPPGLPTEAQAVAGK